MRHPHRPTLTPQSRAWRTGASIRCHSRIRERLTKGGLSIALTMIALHWVATITPVISSVWGAVAVAIPFGILIAGAVGIFVSSD